MGRAIDVRSADGTRIHTEVFGPEDGYPIVLAHGITCAIRVWANQIAELACDYRSRARVDFRRGAVHTEPASGAGDLTTVLPRAPVAQMDRATAF